MSEIPNATPTTHGITSGIANSAPQATPIDIPSWGPSDIDKQVEAFASQYQRELDALPPEAPAAPVDAAAPVSETPAVPAPVQGTMTTEQVQREVELKLREDRLVQSETRISQYESRIKELEARQAPEDLLENIRMSPTATLKQLGLDPDQIIKVALAEKLRALGQPVDPGLSNQIEQANTQRQIKALENKIISQNREAAARSYYDQVQAGARTYVAQELIKDAPSLAEVAKQAPDKVHAEIMQEIISDARVRAQTEGPNGQPMSYSAAAKKVAERWDEYRKVLVPAQAPAVLAPASTTHAQQQVEQKKTPAVIKPPERPLAPWLQKVDVQEQGLREAMDEFRRLENSKI